MTDRAEQKTSRLRGFVLWATVVILCMAGAVGGGLLWLVDRPVAAPDWLRDRVAVRIAQNTDAMRFSFGRVEITVQQGWRPLVRLSDLEFGDGTGRVLFAMSELEASLAMRPLLRGQVRAKQVHLTGIFATLRRDEQGKLSLVTSPDVQAPTRQAATLPELVEQLDDLFLRPEMAALVAFDVDAITLRFEDARAKRVWTIDGARLRVNRDGRDLAISSDLAILGGGTNVATVEANYQSQLGDPEARFGVTVSDMPAQDVASFNPAFGWLGALRAPISGSLRSGVDASGIFAPINATFQIGQGVLQPTAQTDPIPFKAAQAYFTLNPGEDDLVFDLLTIDSAWGKGQMEGRAKLSGLQGGRLDQMTGQLRLSNLVLDPPDLYPEPLALEGAELDFRLRPDPFRIDLGQMRVVDQGESILIDGHVEADPEGWNLAVDATMARITPERLLALWPPEKVGKTRAWLGENLLAGRLIDLEGALRIRPDSDKPDIYASFGFDDADVRYASTLPVVQNAKGVASLYQDRFVVAVDRGRVSPPDGGSLDVSGTSFIVPDVSVRDGPPAVVRLRTSGPIAATLSLLDQPPMNILSKSGLPVDLAEGRAEVDATLSLPLKTGGGALQFTARADLRDVVSERLVPQRRIEAARLAVTASNERVEISGRGAFDGLPADVAWSQALGPDTDGASRLTADVELSEQAVDTLNLGLPNGMVGGAGPGRLTMDFARDTPPRFALSSNLSGVSLSVPQLGWSLSRSGRGELAVSGRLGPNPAIDALTLRAPGLNATGRVSLRDGGGLEAASFDRVRIGDWLDAPVRLVGRGAGAAPAVQVQGGALDLRRAEFGGGGGGGGSGQAGPISLALNRLQITDQISLTDFRGDFSLRAGLNGAFSGSVNGAAPVNGEVAPQNGRSAFRIRSGNAGRVFAAAGFLKQARGGDMNLILRPVGTAGAFNGTLNIANTRVTDAPAIAALFNALSVVGLLEQMGGQGLHFNEVEAAFRLTPDKVTLTEASAVGPSIGLSMDGVYDVNAAQMDMRGVFSPIYLINGVGSLLTRKGEGLIGFNFRLSGPASSPRVQVNPLSALTPSIFRELFRTAPPEVALEPGETAPDLPERQDDTAPRQPVDPPGLDR